jgi:hypothetical protein
MTIRAGSKAGKCVKMCQHAGMFDMYDLASSSSAEMGQLAWQQRIENYYMMMPSFR